VASIGSDVACAELWQLNGSVYRMLFAAVELISFNATLCCICTNRYLKTSGCTHVPGVNDAQDFVEVEEVCV
jgi:hypothetical protein